ncbi:MAG: biotin/lipoyl-containing protein [Chloroflexota bacterium]
MSDPILDAIDRLAPAFAASGLDALEVEADELLVRLARPQQLAAPAPTASPSAVATPVSPPAPAAADAPWGVPAAGRRFVTAPLTGIWYAAPSPGARAYVEPGSEVAAGAVIGLIEAMKLFNEIKTDVAGTVTRVMAESGQLVKRQQPLLEIDPS